MNNTFVAIDFETADGKRNSACAVGIVTFENGEITDEYYTLIQPPNNSYHWGNVRVHGIKAKDTQYEEFFDGVFPEIYERLKGKAVIAHNESFDRSVLRSCMEHYHLLQTDLNLYEPWECTMKIYRDKGFKPYNLAACSKVMNIQLNHHEALSDARACGLLFLNK
ncbi:MAG: 3'-5' exonuclease [Bacteroidales bacterium]|nr:3'-5' exonuclease [Bacteroidales bacterium]